MLFTNVFFCVLFTNVYVSCSGLVTSVGEKRELTALQLFICNYVVSVMRYR